MNGVMRRCATNAFAVMSAPKSARHKKVVDIGRDSEVAIIVFC
jgi:hypothetical protein